MKYNHNIDYFSKVDNEEIVVSWNFTNDLSDDTLSSTTVTCKDSEETDVSSLISSITTSTPSVTFVFTGGTVDETYQITITGTSSNGRDYIQYITCEVFGSVTLNANIADPSANSYSRVDEANTYIKNKYGHNNLWDTMSIEGKKRVLIQAANDLEGFNYIEDKYYNNQGLEFPRNDHDIVSGDCATPFTINSFSDSGFTSDTYGAEKSNTNFWKYGSIHITSGTPLHDVRSIETSNISTDVLTMFTDFTATPNANTDFIAFEPLSKYIKYAQIEQALYIIESKSAISTSQYSAIADEVEFDEVRVKFKKGASMSKKISIKARKLLGRWIERNIKVRRA